MSGRYCKHRKENGEQCRARPLRTGDLCLWHDPDQDEVVTQARQLGGQRRRREKVVALTYDFEGLGTIEAIRRLVEVAALDTLGLENGVNRNRTLGSLAQTAAKLLETGELESRLEALESVLEPRVKALRGRSSS